jgi:hypothetical protein
VVEGNQRSRTKDCEGSYEPIVPRKVGNRRATEFVAATGPTGGKGRTNRRIEWRKHDDPQRSSNHVHEIHSNS